MRCAYPALSWLLATVLGISPGELLALGDGVIEPEGETIEDGEVIGGEAAPLRGVVIRQTMTHLGDEFYRFFSQDWRQQDLAAPRPILIEEQPSAQDGSRIRVRYSQDVLFETTLRPHGPDPAQVAEQAVGQVTERVASRIAAGRNER